ncbi:hypothetical protein MHYP_G00102080 [Metynnis hypsauchen]
MEPSDGLRQKEQLWESVNKAPTKEMQQLGKQVLDQHGEPRQFLHKRLEVRSIHQPRSSMEPSDGLRQKEQLWEPVNKAPPKETQQTGKQVLDQDGEPRQLLHSESPLDEHQLGKYESCPGSRN